MFSTQNPVKNIENLKLSEGKIEVNYFKSILKTIMENCGRVEFSPKSNYAWRWNDVPVGMIADLLSSSATKAAPTFVQTFCNPAPAVTPLKAIWQICWNARLKTSMNKRQSTL